MKTLCRSPCRGERWTFWHHKDSGDRTTIANPYKPSEGREHRRYTSFDGLRLQVATAVGFLGCFFGAILCGIGHLLTFMILEDSFSPPLQAQGNMGQFGFLTVYVGFFGGLAGLSLGLIPYTRFLGWFPVFLLVAFLAAFTEPLDLSTTSGFAMLVVGLAVLLSSSLINLGCRFLLR
ncbi:hypothetical protein [Stieleria maiorica]|uniref:hypothetical protein n=1 Tax=Stieleria maiorica TaxID=2795974 RepID=UPI0011C9ED48|nr:hypothetical protein [Stieleria maiorica]